MNRPGHPDFDDFTKEGCLYDSILVVVVLGIMATVIYLIGWK